jgi:hypothetical protein
LGVLVSNNNTQIPATAPSTAVPATVSTVPPTNNTPIIIQMPSFQSYPYPPFNQLNMPIDHKIPSCLNQRYNCDGVYSQFENAFLEEEITVNAIKDLSDEQLRILGVIKIGWQKNIRQEAQRY